MIIDDGANLIHYGKKGMHWGKTTGGRDTRAPTATRQEAKAINKALSPKGHKVRNARFAQDPVHAHQISLLTDKLVAQALAKPDSIFRIRSEHNELVVSGQDFAENVIGRIGTAHLSGFKPSVVVTRNSGR